MNDPFTQAIDDALAQAPAAVQAQACLDWLQEVGQALDREQAVLQEQIQAMGLALREADLDSAAGRARAADGMAPREREEMARLEREMAAFESGSQPQAALPGPGPARVGARRNPGRFL